MVNQPRFFWVLFPITPWERCLSETHDSEQGRKDTVSTDVNTGNAEFQKTGKTAKRGLISWLHLTPHHHPKCVSGNIWQAETKAWSQSLLLSNPGTVNRHTYAGFVEQSTAGRHEWGRAEGWKAFMNEPASRHRSANIPSGALRPSTPLNRFARQAFPSSTAPCRLTETDADDTARLTEL